MLYWQTSRRKLNLDRTLVMAILNVTPDSFSDGGRTLSIDDALQHAEKMIGEGADIIDIGGESTRPGRSRVSVEEEVGRVVPVIEAIRKHFEIPISVDTSKSEVARASVNAGAEIINDISGLRFDEGIAEVAAKHGTGLILMHSRGSFESMHDQNYAVDVFEDVSRGFQQSIDKAVAAGVRPENIVLDVGIGFGKSQEQNLELIAKLHKLTDGFPRYPMLCGTSRKSFIGKILGGAPTGERLSGSLATAAIAVWNGAKIVRVHDVKGTVETLKVVNAIKTIGLHARE